MNTRDHVQMETSEVDIVVSTSLPPRLEPPREPITGEPSRHTPRPLVVVVLGLLAAAAIGIAIAALLAMDDDDPVAKPAAQQPAELPAQAAGLAVTATGPATANVGEPVEIAIRYTDGSGQFSGTLEEWGDGVGTSSVSEGQCSATAEAPQKLADSYAVSHTWTEPGTYSVVVGVHTYTCQGTTAVQEKATDTLVVQVLAR